MIEPNSKIFNFSERILAVAVPITFVFFERYFIEEPSFRILDAYVLTQFVQIILGASIFLAFYKKNINVWNVKIYQTIVYLSLLMGIILYNVTDNLVVLFTASYISCVPIELQNVFRGMHVTNLKYRIYSIICALLVFYLSGSLELSFAVERSVFAVSIILENRSKKQYERSIGWSNSIKFYQVLPLYFTGLLTLVYGRFEQLYLVQFGDKLQLANYIFALRGIDITILLLNSFVLSKISQEKSDMRSLRQIIDFGAVTFILLSIFTITYFGLDFRDTFTIAFIILINYYFMSWGIVKALYTHHTLTHTNNLLCQIIGVLFVVLYFFSLMYFYDLGKLPFVAVILIPAVGQIGTNLIGPAVLKSERRFLYLLFRKESKE